MPTAFRGEFGASGATVAILAEYDALPNGHSCGHNLISGGGARRDSRPSARTNRADRHAGRRGWRR